MLMCIQTLVRFGQFILKVLSENEILTSIKGHNSVKILQKEMGNNPKLGLVNVDVYTTIDLILSSHSQDIEWKQIVHGKTERQKDGITELRKDRVNPV